MDGAGASDPYRTVGAELSLPGHQASMSRGAAAVSTEAFGVSRRGAAAGADLGGSSKYSNENFED
jgi:hypothetical protein